MRERKNGVIEWTMRHYQITLLVITVLVGLGILGLVDMPKQEFPEFTIRQGVVVGVYPGATSGEEQLAKPLERYLFTFKEVKKKKTYSMSRDGMVYMMVELNDDVNNKDEVWSKIKLGLQNFKSQLPSGVLAVIANDDFGDTSALLITLESEDKTYRELQRYMETLEDRLRRIESVSNLRRYGVQNEQISVLGSRQASRLRPRYPYADDNLVHPRLYHRLRLLGEWRLGHSHPPFRDLSLGAGSRRADPAGRCRRAYDPLERRGPYRTGISRAG